MFSDRFGARADVALQPTPSSVDPTSEAFAAVVMFTDLGDQAFEAFQTWAAEHEKRVGLVLQRGYVDAYADNLIHAKPPRTPNPTGPHMVVLIDLDFVDNRHGMN